jgi:hypothetical protein
MKHKSSKPKNKTVSEAKKGSGGYGKVGGEAVRMKTRGTGAATQGLYFYSRT